MKAAYVDAPGGAETIVYGDLPDAVPGPGEALVRVEAVAVNQVDAIVRSGRWRTPLLSPAVLGRDLVGTIVAFGEGGGGSAMAAFAVGDRVWTNSAGYGGRPGATAELVPVPVERLYPVPAGADPIGFVGTVHPGATAHGALADRARLRAGETLLVIGGNGSIGITMVQVGAALGATVVAVVRDEACAVRLRELGASEVIVEVDDPVAAVARACPDGVDVVVDTTGHLDIGGIVAHLRPRGRVVLVAGRVHVDLDLWAFEVNELELLGFIMSAMALPQLTAAAGWMIAQYPNHPLVADIGAVLPFSAARQAHELLDAGALPRTENGMVGRLILVPDGALS